jgi:hypothetical protein
MAAPPLPASLRLPHQPPPDKICQALSVGLAATAPEVTHIPALSLVQVCCLSPGSPDSPHSTVCPIQQPKGTLKLVSGITAHPHVSPNWHPIS